MSARAVPGWVLKGSAVCLTVLATVGAAAYVGGHVKNGSAPLRPAVQPQSGVQGPPGAPGVTATDRPPLTETHES